MANGPVQTGPFRLGRAGTRRALQRVGPSSLFPRTGVDAEQRTGRAKADHACAQQQQADSALWANAASGRQPDPCRAGDHGQGTVHAAKLELHDHVLPCLIGGAPMVWTVSTDDTRACDLGHRGLAASARRAAASSIVTRSRATTSQPGCSKRLGSRVTIWRTVHSSAGSA